MSIADRLRQKGAKAPAPRTTPLWKGPCNNEDNGGVTYSLLSRWLCDKERFRLHALEGLRIAPTFSPYMDYGNMWHLCEEVWAAQPARGMNEVYDRLQVFCRRLCRKYPTQQKVVSHWYEMCKAQFPLYADYWKNDKIQSSKRPILQEHVFGVPYSLRSGREVFLRGKLDSVDNVEGSIWIQDNKTKSQIDKPKILKQLTFDLQSMLYVIILGEYKKRIPSDHSHAEWKDLPIEGILYNVVRRSAHKSPASMVKKITEDRRAGRIGEWFDRIPVPVSKQAITRFRKYCLDPMLEAVCQWWDAIRHKGKDLFDDPKQGIHWIHPYGCRNILDEGGTTDLDNHILTGSEVGLVRCDQLFPELVEE